MARACGRSSSQRNRGALQSARNVSAKVERVGAKGRTKSAEACDHFVENQENPVLVADRTQPLQIAETPPEPITDSTRTAESRDRGFAGALSARQRVARPGVMATVYASLASRSTRIVPEFPRRRRIFQFPVPFRQLTEDGDTLGGLRAFQLFLSPHWSGEFALDFG